MVAKLRDPRTALSQRCFWQGELVRLRPLHRKDSDLWLTEDEDSEAVRFLGYGIELPKSRAAAQAFSRKYADFKNSADRIMFSIETLDGTLVGGINIHTMNKKNGTFGTGTRIYRQYRKRGYAAEAKRIVLRYAFHELRFQKYNVACIESNKAEIKHLCRLGCKEEGRRRRNIYTNGRYYDELLFGMTRDEFDAMDRQ
jgi:RimJ/RimL family protein N-acetyltransferase